MFCGAPGTENIYFWWSGDQNIDFCWAGDKKYCFLVVRGKKKLIVGGLGIENQRFWKVFRASGLV